MKGLLLLLMTLFSSSIVFAQYPVSNQKSYFSDPLSSLGLPLTKKNQPHTTAKKATNQKNNERINQREQSKIDFLFTQDDRINQKLDNGTWPAMSDTMFNILQDSVTLVESAIYFQELKRDEISFLPSIPLQCMRDTIKRFDKFSSLQGAVSKGFFTFIYSKCNIGTLQNTVLQTQGSLTSFYTELVSDYMGPVRLSLSSLITATKDTVHTDVAKQQLMSGGGNALLACEFPFFYWCNENVLTYISFESKIAGDIPLLGSKTSNTAANWSYGLQIYQDFSTDLKQINIFGLMQFSQVVGLTPTYYDNLNLRRNPFPYGTMYFGITIFSNFKISFSFPMFGPNSSLLKVPMNYGGQVLPTITK